MTGTTAFGKASKKPLYKAFICGKINKRRKDVI